MKNAIKAEVVNPRDHPDAPPSVMEEIDLAVAVAKKMQEQGVRAPYAIKVTTVSLFPAVPVMIEEAD